MEGGEVSSSEGKEGESVQHLGKNLRTTPESCRVSPPFSATILLADFNKSSPTHHLRYSRWLYCVKNKLHFQNCASVSSYEQEVSYWSKSELESTAFSTSRSG